MTLHLTLRAKILSIVCFIIVLGVILTQVPSVQALIGNVRGTGVSSAGQALHQPIANANGLLYWYHFDGNANDSGPSGYNLTSGTNGGYISGEFGKAITFTNSAQYMQYASGMSFPTGTASVSASLWVNPTAYPASGSAEGFFRFGSAANVFEMTNASGVQNLCVNDGPSYYCTAYSLPLNTWSFVTETYDGTNVKIWVNGTSVSTQAATFATTAGVFIVGDSNTGGSAPFSGALDDLRFYNRALSASEITQLFQGSSPLGCDQSCVAWWKLDANSGTSAADATGNGYTGTLKNGSSNSPAADGSTYGPIWTGGVFGSGLSFNGTTACVTTSDLPTTSQISVGLWFYLNYDPFPFAASLFGTVQNGPVLNVDSDGTLGYGIVDNSGTSSSITTINTISLGGWHQATLVMNVVDTKLYLDGILVGTKVNTVSLTTASTFHNSFGCSVSAGTYSQFFPGLIDDIRFYNRALTAREAAALYAAGNSST